MNTRRVITWESLLILIFLIVGCESGFKEETLFKDSCKINILPHNEEIVFKDTCVERKKNPFKVRVEHFTEKNYCIKYTFDGGTWEIYSFVYISEVSQYLDRNFPYIYLTFEEAVRVAKGLTLENVKRHIQTQERKWQKEIAKRQAERERFWESE